MILFRPVGLHELQLLHESGMRAFPPRLPEQPFFYPVLNEGYARQIARDWNTRSGALAGFVTRFDVDDAYVARFERHVVGGREHEELWVPADQLPEFNQHVRGAITVVSAWFGAGYAGFVPQSSCLRHQDAAAQFTTLAGLSERGVQDLHFEVAANPVAVFLNFFFWEQHDFSAQGIDCERRDRLLRELRQVWQRQQETGPALGVVPPPELHCRA